MRELAQGRRETFAAWQVESRAPDQLLLCDFRGGTRSWLMVIARREGTLLHFGSARAVARAGLSDLCAVEGINETVAKKIYDHFHGG